MDQDTTERKSGGVERGRIGRVSRSRGRAGGANASSPSVKTIIFTPEFPASSAGNAIRLAIEGIIEATIESNRLKRDGNEYNLHHKSLLYYLGRMESYRQLLNILVPSQKDRLIIEKMIAKLVIQGHER